MTAWKRRAVKKRMEIVKALERWRFIRNMTQEDVCRATGSAQAQFSRIESGTAGVSLGLLLDMGSAVKVELMIVPLELREHVKKMVERLAEERELDLGPRVKAGRKRGTSNKPPVVASMMRGFDASGVGSRA